MDHERKRWVTERKKGLGGSDIAAVMGLSPYRRPIDVYLDKTGDTEQPVSPRMEAGQRLEAAVAGWYADREQVPLELGSLIVHPQRDWQRGTPDRIVPLARKVVECKTAGAMARDQWGEDGTDEVPDAYVMQVQWYMDLVGYELADVAALFEGWDFRVYRLKRDDELIAMAREAGAKFWRDHVLARVPPEPDGSESWTKALKARWPRSVEPLKRADTAIEDVAADLREAKERMAEAAQRAERAEQVLKDFIGIGAGVEGSFGKITWKNDAKGRCDWKAVAHDFYKTLMDGATESQKPVFLAAWRELVAQHTPAIGPRRFLPTWAEVPNVDPEER